MAEIMQQDEMIPPKIDAWFVRGISLDELIYGIAPLGSIDGLAIHDLPPEEAEPFLQATED